MARSQEKQKLAVFGYARVSTDKQEHSIPAQVSKIKLQAALKELELTEIIEDEDASAKSLDRPGINRLMEMVEQRKVSTIIVAKLDRLTRSVRDLCAMVERFERRNVTLISVDESLDTKSAVGRMVMNIMASVSQGEREVIGERTRIVMADMKRRGLQTGNVPYGFSRGKVVGVNRHEKPVYDVTPKEAEQDILRLISKMRTQSLSFQDIADELNKSGYRTRRGGEWKPEYVWNAMRSFKKGVV